MWLNCTACFENLLFKINCMQNYLSYHEFSIVVIKLFLTTILQNEINSIIWYFDYYVITHNVVLWTKLILLINPQKFYCHLKKSNFLFFYYLFRFKQQGNCFGDVMVSVLASKAVDHGFEHWMGHTKDDKICICCFSANHAALRTKSKNCLESG